MDLLSITEGFPSNVLHPTPFRVLVATLLWFHKTVFLERFQLEGLTYLASVLIVGMLLCGELEVLHAIDYWATGTTEGVGLLKL